MYCTSVLCTLSHLQSDDEVGDEEAEHDEDPGPHREEGGNKADGDGAIPDIRRQRILYVISVSLTKYALSSKLEISQIMFRN